MKRGPQIITPKDAALIIAYTGIEPGSKVVDAGTGSAFLTVFLAKYLRPGKIYTYEKDERFVKLCKENIKNSGLSKFIKLKHADITKGIKEKNVDLITLDLKDAKKVLRHAKTSLKLGGKIVIYSPTINHLMEIIDELKKKKFANIKTIEAIVREWKTEYTIRPNTTGIMHTGFLTFAKKVQK